MGVLGIVYIDKLKYLWSTLNISIHGVGGGGHVSDGILMCLQKLNLSCLEIQSFLPVGSARLCRVKRLKSCSLIPQRNLHKHDLSSISVRLFRYFMESLDTEDGFACAHWQIKRYIVSSNPNITWTRVYEDYVEFIQQKK